MRASASSLSQGLSISIVNTLKTYKQAVPIDFLAKVLHRQRFEIVTEINNLEESRVIKREGEYVSLTTE